MKENKSSYPQDINFIKGLLVEKELPADQIVTEANGKLIYQLMTDYKASLFDMENAIINSLTSELTLDPTTLENTCRELFTADSAVHVSPGDIKTLSAEALLTKLTVGNTPDQRDIQNVQEIREQTELNDQVINLLFYYLYVKKTKSRNRKMC